MGEGKNIDGGIVDSKNIPKQKKEKGFEKFKKVYPGYEDFFDGKSYFNNDGEWIRFQSYNEKENAVYVFNGREGKKGKKIKYLLDKFDDLIPEYGPKVEPPEEKEEVVAGVEVIEDDKKKILPEVDDVEDENKKGSPDVEMARTAVRHILTKIENSELNAPSEKEGDELFLKKAREFWKEFAVHGFEDFDENGNPHFKAETDLDGKGFIKMLQLAGLDTTNLEYVLPGTHKRKVFTGDSGNRDGIVSINEGESLIADHHGGKSDRDTSATRHAYQLLVNVGLLEKADYLTRFTHLVTREDNRNFNDSEIQQLFGKGNNYARTIFGLSQYLDTDAILELFKKYKNYKDILPNKFLQETKGKDPKTGREVTLLEASKQIEKDVLLSQKNVEKMKENGFEIDSGDERYGKVLIDMGGMVIDDITDKKIYFQKVKLGFEIARANGYGAYVLWMPEDKRFKVYTDKRMDFKFSQGVDVRGHYWTKTGADKKDLEVTLEEILSKICGKETEIEGSLKIAIENEEKNRRNTEEQVGEMRELIQRLLDEVSPDKYSKDKYAENVITRAEKLYAEVQGIVAERTGKNKKIKTLAQKLSLLKKKGAIIERFNANVLAGNFELDKDVLAVEPTPAIDVAGNLDSDKDVPVAEPVSTVDVIDDGNKVADDTHQEEIKTIDNVIEKDKEIEFSKKELRFIEEYRRDVQQMIKFIEGEYYASGAEKIIADNIENFWDVFEKEMAEEGYISGEEKIKKVISDMRKSVEKEKIKDNSNEDNGAYEDLSILSQKDQKKFKNGPLKSQQEVAFIREKKLYAEMDEKRKNQKDEEREKSKALDQENKNTIKQEFVTKNETNEKAEKFRETIFDINNKEQQIEMIREGKVYYAEKMGREKNLEKAFVEFEKDNEELLESYKGKDILLKVNLVDPDNAQACTSSETIKKVVELMEKYKPKRIYIGDIPSAMGKKGRNWDELRKIYENKLGYAFGPNTELINLEDLENETIKDGEEEFEVKKLDRFGGVINISRPKMHGEFGYTGCTKNLMGFMTQKSRENMIHMAKETYDSKKANARLNKFSSAILKNQPTMINVSDGFDFVSGHEHIGIPEKTDFAMVSRDPFNADNEAMQLIGLNKNRVTYVRGKEFPIVNGKLNGMMERNNLYPSNLEKKTMLYEIKSDGRPSFVDMINDPKFLNNLGIKRRLIATCLEGLKNAFADDMKRNGRQITRDEYVKGIERFVAGKSFEEFFNGMFSGDGAKAYRESNPYNNNNMPEFRYLVGEWIRNQK